MQATRGKRCLSGVDRLLFEIFGAIVTMQASTLRMGFAGLRPHPLYRAERWLAPVVGAARFAGRLTINRCYIRQQSWR